jgi:HAD superfamily hydrolase (TIGR01490 family)
MRLVIFDFCDTLVNFQSADSFVRFSLKNYQSLSSILILITDKVLSHLRIYSILRKLGLSNNFQKQILLRGMKGISKAEINQLALKFNEEVIQKKLNKSIYKLLAKHISNKDEIIINSGGYDVYLDVFARNLGIEKVYATRFKYINEVFSGQILGEDCLNDEKISRMISDGFDFNNYKEIIVYSDSVTDMPLFNIATSKFAVIKEATTPEWCNSDSFQILKV